MPRIHVCPLSLVSETVAGTGADRLITLINAATPVTRPASIPPERHLFIPVNDIIEPTEGLTAPSLQHVSALLDFGRAWDRRQPLVVHCFAGISRSTAAAFILVCALSPDRREEDVARTLRAASPFATPNRLLVSIADATLGRGGRMIAAIDSIGMGILAEQSVPFHLSLAA